MAKARLLSPIKFGFLIVSLAYFLFAFHAAFKLSWVGEWEAFNEPLKSIVFVEDIAAAIGITSRLVASAIALGGVILYLKNGLPTPKVKQLLRLVLIGEGIFWLGLLVTGVLSVSSTLGVTIWRVNGHISSLPLFTSLMIYEVPILVESIAIPAVLFKLSHQLNPNKPEKQAIKWGLIAGAVYVLSIWLTNTAIWTSTVMRQGLQYLTSYPENLLSFTSTTIGLLGLLFFIGYFAKKSGRIANVDELDFKTIGGIITALGLFYLWNYLNWIFFGKDIIWSNWYGWFLGNNLNLWLLSIPLVGLPLLFKEKLKSQSTR